jgi:hypothetical protein
LFTRHALNTITWPLTTKSWIEFNDTNDICSVEKSKKEAFKIKCLNHILPCGDILTAHYPSLYDSNLLPVKCPICNNEDDTNQHLGFCPELIQPLNEILTEAKESLYNQLILEINSFLTNATLSRDLELLELFQPIKDNSIYLLIHNIVPQSLVDLVHSHTRKFNHTKKIIMEFMAKIQHFCYTLI